METAEKASLARAKKTQGKSTVRAIVKKALLVTVAFFLLVLFDANYNTFSALKDGMQAKGKWQAVFLSNGQIYFGHLSPYGMKYFVLKDAYYIQSSRVPAPAPQAEGAAPTETEEQPQFETRNELVKVTGDLHGPENAMFIPREQILFWQNLRSDSGIVRTGTSARN